MADPTFSTSAPNKSGKPTVSRGTTCFGGRPPQQIGLVVRDIDASLRTYSAIMGIGPWDCYTYDWTNVRDLVYRGSRARYSMKIALSTTAPQIELIQPLVGPSVYEEWMATHGDGVHHFAYVVPSIDDGIREMGGLGYSVIQYGAGFGLDDDGAFAYFDTADDLGTTIELRMLPLRRRPPEHTFGIGAPAVTDCGCRDA
jgi:hypothetical protein